MERLHDLPAWAVEAAKAALPHIPKRFTGYLQLNCSQGSVGTVQMFQTAKMEHVVTRQP